MGACVARELAVDLCKSEEGLERSRTGDGGSLGSVTAFLLNSKAQITKSVFAKLAACGQYACADVFLNCQTSFSHSRPYFDGRPVRLYREIMLN